MFLFARDRDISHVSFSDLGEGFIRRVLKISRDSNAKNFRDTEEVWTKCHFLENEYFFYIKN